MSTFSYALLLLILNAARWDGVSTQEDSGCTTPDRRKGQCISIRQCPPLINLLQRERPVPSNILDFLNRSQCGFDGKTPIVCCPFSIQNPTPLEVNQPRPNLLEASSFKDVSNHPRLRALLPEYCGELNEDDRITMGDTSSLHEFPWMALLGYLSNLGGVDFRCDGSLINARYVLTAAHCITKQLENKLVIVRLGEHDLRTDIDCQLNVGCSPPVQDIEPEEIIPHPLYSKSHLKNDIGLIRLSRDVTLTTSVSPICLPIGRNEQLKSLEGTKVTVTGWGRTELSVNSPVLLKVTIPVMPLDRCAQVYSQKYQVTGIQICAGGTDGKDSCNGDSGGPLQSLSQRGNGPAYVQYGVVSFGPTPCGNPGLPGVYTRVGYYMQWILDTMRP